MPASSDNVETYRSHHEWAVAREQARQHNGDQYGDNYYFIFNQYINTSPSSTGPSADPSSSDQGLTRCPIPESQRRNFNQYRQSTSRPQAAALDAYTQSRIREERETDETQDIALYHKQSPYSISEERIRSKSEPEPSISRNQKQSEQSEAWGSGTQSHLGVCVVLRPYKYGKLELKTGDLVIAFDETSHQCLCKVNLWPWSGAGGERHWVPKEYLRRAFPLGRPFRARMAFYSPGHLNVHEGDLIIVYKVYHSREGHVSAFVSCQGQYGTLPEWSLYKLGVELHTGD